MGFVERPGAEKCNTAGGGRRHGAAEAVEIGTLSDNLQLWSIGSPFRPGLNQRVETLFGAHAAMYAVWNAMEDLVGRAEAAQWALEKVKLGHPTESHHVMARVAHFQALERRYIPGAGERLGASDGFGEVPAVA